MAQEGFIERKVEWDGIEHTILEIEEFNNPHPLTWEWILDHPEECELGFIIPNKK